MGLPKVSLGPSIPDPSMPCRQATPETTISTTLLVWTPHAYVLRSRVFSKVTFRTKLHGSEPVKAVILLL
jgi:hypothetical protein